MKLMMRCIPMITVALLVACGGGEPATDDAGGDGMSAPPTTSQPTAPTPPSGPMTMPEWFALDGNAETVDITLVAGQTSDNNYWNFNGVLRGGQAITVPVGYTVTITLENRDPVMAHSVGVSAETSDFMMPPAPEPVFAGAISENPVSMTDATMPGESETIQFVASEAGNYSLVCYIPGHAATGMWLYFNVSGDGEAGVQVR